MPFECTGRRWSVDIGSVRRALETVVEMEREDNGLGRVGGEDGGVDVDVSYGTFELLDTFGEPRYPIRLGYRQSSCRFRAGTNLIAEETLECMGISMTVCLYNNKQCKF
jgi:hypothetical protein